MNLWKLWMASALLGDAGAYAQPMPSMVDVYRAVNLRWTATGHIIGHRERLETPNG